MWCKNLFLHSKMFQNVTIKYCFFFPDLPSILVYFTKSNVRGTRKNKEAPLCKLLKIVFDVKMYGKHFIAYCIKCRYFHFYKNTFFIKVNITKKVFLMLSILWCWTFCGAKMHFCQQNVYKYIFAWNVFLQSKNLDSTFYLKKWTKTFDQMFSSIS